MNPAEHRTDPATMRALVFAAALGAGGAPRGRSAATVIDLAGEDAFMGFLRRVPGCLRTD